MIESQNITSCRFILSVAGCCRFSREGLPAVLMR